MVKNILTAFSVSCIIIAGCQVSGRDSKAPKMANAEVPAAIPPINKDFEQYHSRVKAFMEENLLRRGFNGAILIAKDSTVLYEQYKGFADLRKRDSILPSTPFHIASTSKTFTAMAVLQLVQDGSINLDDSLEKFFPGFPYTGVTIKTLLTHRSGIPNYLYVLENKGWNGSHKISNQEVLQALIDLKPAKEFKPDTRFSYCNTNYVLLALVLESVTGKPYPVYMKEKLFDPLGLEHTYVFTSDKEGLVTPSFRANGRYWQLDFSDNTYGDKNIYTTPSDLLKWNLAVNEGRVIGKALLDSAYLPYSNERPSVHNYGLGWRMLNLKNGKKIIYHNGRWHGSNSAFAYLPEEKVTIIIIGNKYNSNIYQTARKAYDIFGAYFQKDSETDEDDAGNLVNQTHSSRDGMAVVVSPTLHSAATLMTIR